MYPPLLPLMRTPLLPVVDWTNAPRRFKWTRPFRRKTKSGFRVCAITFQLASTVEDACLTAHLFWFFIFKNSSFTVKLRINVYRKNYKSKSIVIMTDPFELVYQIGLASFYLFKCVNSKKLHHDTNKMFLKIKNRPAPTDNTPKNMDTHKNMDKC
jgi:hypothetical protein